MTQQLWLCIPLDLKDVDLRERCQRGDFGERNLNPDVSVLWKGEDEEAVPGMRPTKFEFSLVLRCISSLWEAVISPHRQKWWWGYNQASERVYSLGQVMWHPRMSDR